MHTHWTRWANMILGIWLVVSPFILDFTSYKAIINNIIIGVLVIAFAYIASQSYTTAKSSI